MILYVDLQGTCIFIQYQVTKIAYLCESVEHSFSQPCYLQYIPKRDPTVFIQSPVSGHLAFSSKFQQLLAVLSYIWGVCVCYICFLVQIYVSFRYMPRREFVGFKNECSNLQGNGELFSKVIVLIYTLTTYESLIKLTWETIWVWYVFCRRNF